MASWHPGKKVGGGPQAWAHIRRLLSGDDDDRKDVTLDKMVERHVCRAAGGSLSALGVCSSQAYRPLRL